MIDSNLSWKYHIEYICHKISKSIGIIAKIRHYVPRQARNQDFMWGGANEAKVDQITEMYFLLSDPFI